MKKTTQFLCIAMSLLFAMNAKSQNVSIGTPTPNSSALLEVKSTNKGILIPQVSLASLSDIATIAAPATGLLVFNTNAGLPGGIGYYYNAGTTTSANWLQFQTGSGSGWGLTGNSGTDGTINFLGTNDAQPLVFHVNGGYAGLIGVDGNLAIGRGAVGTQMTPLPDVIAIGDSAMYNNTDDSSSIAIGNSALYSNSSSGFNENIAIGSLSQVSSSQGFYNTTIGSYTLASSDTGYLNVAIGYGSCYSSTSSYNTAVGAFTLTNDASGIENTAFGRSVLYNSTSGYYNTGLGSRTGYKITTGYRNTFTGNFSGYNSTTGYKNCALGAQSLFGNTTGFKNIAIGGYAGVSNTTGSQNIFIGDSANASTGALTNAIAIGVNAVVNASNKVVIGNTSATSIGGQVNWSTFSDGRYKKDIVENVKGLDFIMELRPVTYSYDFEKINSKLYATTSPDFISTGFNTNKLSSLSGKAGKKVNFKSNFRIRKEGGILGNIKNDDNNSVSFPNPNEGVRFTGFIAQEVEAAAKKTGFDFSGVDKPTNENGNYALRYAEFVVPLVKAVQEQQAIIDAQNKKIDDLVKRLEKLEQK